MEHQEKKKKLLIPNLIFALVCCGILLFLLRAPEESTVRLPKDEKHKEFFSIKSKKEAEKFCNQCHGEKKDAALPANHPPKYRCLFCHKRK